MWNPFDNGSTIGTKGSEDGIVVRDEEHIDGARISLEQQCRNAPMAITCGIYGIMVHTVYVDEKSGANRYEEMRFGLDQLLTSRARLPREEFHKEVDKFVNQY